MNPLILLSIYYGADSIPKNNSIKTATIQQTPSYQQWKAVHLLRLSLGTDPGQKQCFDIFASLSVVLLYS